MFSPVIFSSGLCRLYYSERMARCLVIFPARYERRIHWIYRQLFGAAFQVDRYATFAFCGFDRRLTAEYFSREGNLLENLIAENIAVRKRLLAEHRQKPRVRPEDLAVIRALPNLPLVGQLISRIRNSSLFKK